MNFIGLLFLIITHFLTGRGLLYLFNIRLKPLHTVSLSMMTGVVIASFIPLVLQFFYIPITATSIIIAIIITTLLFNIWHIRKYKFPQIDFKKIAWPPLYEYPILILLTLLILVSVWHCFYFPPFPRDILSGPEAIAEYTVREHTMLNSVFTVNLESTNNHLKPPYVTGLQIIYKLLVYPFGEMWMSVMFISFIVWMYSLLKEKLHTIIAAIVLFLFIAMPDVFSYTYIILFDYHNMIFFFAGFYFLSLYTDSKQVNHFLFACLLFGFATAIRSETLVLISFIIPMLLYFFRKEHLPASKTILRIALFMLIPFFFYFIWFDVYIKYYMPVKFAVNSEINSNLSDISILTQRFFDVNTQLLFGKYTLPVYGYFIYVFTGILLIDLIFFRKIKRSTEAKIALYGIAVVYFGLPFLGYLIPWVDLLDTTKRGLYKMFPLMLLYFRNSPFLLKISQGINNWEHIDTLPIKAAPGVAQAKMGKPPIAAQGRHSPKKSGKKQK